MHEAAYLAVLPKAPSNYDPIRATKKATDRRNYVLREMAGNGFITEEQRAAAAATGLGTIRYGSNAKFREQGGYFLEEVRRTLLAKYGETAEDGPHSIYAGGLTVRTSMQPVMQDAAAEALREGLASFDGGRGWRDNGLTIPTDGDWAARLRGAAVGTGFPDWRKAVVLAKSGSRAEIGFGDGTTGTLNAAAASQPKRGGGGAAYGFLKPGMIIIVKQLGTDSYALRSIPEIGGGFVAQEVHSGRVLAMQGGFDVIGSSFNRATQAQRQPGSTFKPIVYVTALENGLTPASILVDAPFCVWQGAGLGNKCFVNFDRRYSGPKTLRWGVEQSRNLMTVRAASQVGMDKINANAAEMGVGKYDNYLSIALGAGDTTVLKLTNAYAILANQGREVKPTLIDYVQNRHGKVIYRADNRCAVMDNCNAADWDGRAMPRPPLRARQLIDPQAAYQMVHVLEGVIERGTATVLRSLERPLVRQDGHDQRADQRVVRRRNPRCRRRCLYRLRPAALDGRGSTGWPDRRADLQAMGRSRPEGRPQDTVRGARGYPHGAHRPRDGAPRLRRLPDDRGSQVVGHLGSVPARNRAAPLVPPQRRTCREPRRRSRAALPRGPREASFAAPRRATTGLPTAPNSCKTRAASIRAIPS